MKYLISIALICSSLFSCVLAREDFRTYYDDVKIPAVWINPKNIKVYITPDELKGYIFTRSFKIWDDALGSNLNFKYVNSADEADIIIKYVDKLNGSEAGITKTAHTKIQGKIYLAKAEISISKSSPIGFKYTDVQLNKITLHEIGHAIGILGHSDNVNDIMYYSTATPRLSTVSKKDIETVKKIYGF